MRPRLIFLVGGPDFHPVNEQAATIIKWLGPEFACHTAESLAAFEHLTECDLLVLMGQHWSGWEGRYRSPSDVHRRNFEKYVQSGRPILSAHGAIASYDDWPRYQELIGFGLNWEELVPPPIEEHSIRIRAPHHPVMQELTDFRITDELLPTIHIFQPMRSQTLAQATCAGQSIPVVMTTEGGRILGAGKSLYIGLGHDMVALQTPQLRQLWLNGVSWCLNQT